MKIRDATIDDFPELHRMGVDFAGAAGLPDVDIDTLHQSVENLINGGILKVAENGAICGCAGALVFPHYWNASELIAQELFWWVDKTARHSTAAIRLLNAMENTAKEKGAKSMIMLTLEKLTPDVLEKIYLKRGYKPQERSFVKDL